MSTTNVQRIGRGRCCVRTHLSRSDKSGVMSCVSGLAGSKSFRMILISSPSAGPPPCGRKFIGLSQFESTTLQVSMASGPVPSELMTSHSENS